MSQLIKGNLKDQLGDNERGWVIGYFTDPQHPFHEHDFEVQWAELAEGDIKSGGAGYNKTAKTLCILISGHLKLNFPVSNETVALSEPGAYVYFPPGVSHSWEAIKPTVTMTLRWPSVRGDQEPSSRS
jgi:hypothetical protein